MDHPLKADVATTHGAPLKKQCDPRGPTKAHTEADANKTQTNTLILIYCMDVPPLLVGQRGNTHTNTHTHDYTPFIYFGGAQTHKYSRRHTMGFQPARKTHISGGFICLHFFSFFYSQSRYSWEGHHTAKSCR